MDQRSSLLRPNVLEFATQEKSESWENEEGKGKETFQESRKKESKNRTENEVGFARAVLADWGKVRGRWGGRLCKTEIS